MPNLYMQRVVLTGGPGVGKTALLHALNTRGHAIVRETARSIIHERRARGLSPRPTPLEFARAVLRGDIEQYNRQPARSIYVFFDRSILDALCMIEQVAPLRKEELDKFLSRYPFHRRVFVLPPWEDIYEMDEERDQTFAESVRVHHTIDAWYRRCGYEVVEVPKVRVAERCECVLETLGSART